MYRNTTGYVWYDYCTCEAHYAKDIDELGDQLRASFSCDEKADQTSGESLTVGDIIDKLILCIQCGEHTDADVLLSIGWRHASKLDLEELRETGAVTWMD